MYAGTSDALGVHAVSCLSHTELPAFTAVLQLPPISAVTSIPAVTLQMCTARVLCSGNQIQFPAQSPPPLGGPKDLVLDTCHDKIGMNLAFQVFRILYHSASAGRM